MQQTSGNTKPEMPTLFPGLGAPSNLFPRGGQADIQRAMDIYHQELSRLQQSALAAALKAQNGDGKDDEDKNKSVSDDSSAGKVSPRPDPEHSLVPTSQSLLGRLNSNLITFHEWIIMTSA